MKPLDIQLASIKKQIEEAPWLRWAALVTAILIALFALQALDKWRISRQKASIEAELNLKKILALNGQEVWLDRASQAQKLYKSLSAQLPEVSTVGMAQASFQSWLRDSTSILNNQKSVSIRINSAGPIESSDDIIKVNASLNGNISPNQALIFIKKIEASPNLIIVETINIQSDTTNSLQLTINAFYRIRETANS